jgi:phage terminase large subunit GpA-like protein
MGDLVLAAYAEGIRPEPRLTVSQWADKYRLLPQKSSAEPGPWRTARAPYLREILDCLSPTSDVEEVVLMKGAQLGGSEVILNALGYIIDHAPGPTLLVQPTVELAKRFSRQRIEPLFTSTPRLAGKVAEEKSRDHRASMLQKQFLGGVLVITGANSAVGLRSMPARWLLLDEIDGYPVDVDGEGAPIDLAEARQRTFARRKRIKVSTPTVAGISPVEAAFLATDQRRYFIPCPTCGEYQTLELGRLVWTKFELPPAKAVYECVACGARIEDHQKTGMLERGEWRATAEEATDPKIRGYHLSALYSPVGWLSWGQLAEQFVKVHKNPEKLRVFTNTVLGETWQDRGEAPEWEALYHRRETYPLGTVPAGALLLTAGVDVQKDRLVVEIVAWGPGKTSWSIDYGILPGDTADLTGGAWGQLDELLARTFPGEGGADMSIRMLAVDSGFNTQSVYSWARKYPMSRVIAIKGQPGGGALIGAPSAIDITLRGKRPISGYKVWPVHGAVAKSELYGFLRLEQPTGEDAFPPGYCHFPQYDEDYFKQLTAEHLVTHKTRGGFIRLEWEMIPGRENHVLDARVYARAAASLAGMDRWRSENQVGLAKPAGPSPVSPRPAPRESWLNRHRGRA